MNTPRSIPALGLSADEFLTSLVNGAEAGVFSIDKVGDAVKEFNIRAKDGSDSTIEAFSSPGHERGGNDVPLCCRWRLRQRRLL